ncbi:MAG: TrkA family potassium uptake protein [Clostridia bacterium]|nr:TrkA family potassium uptake protein [Clostridia bacterium]
MAKKKNSQFAIIGLGQFGTALAKRLYEMDKDVLAIDIDEEKINQISSYVTHSIEGDGGDEDVLKKIGINNFDVVAVCMGNKMQSSILATLICKQMGVKYIIAKAQNEKHKSVLEKIGADLIVFPEVDMGKKIASRLVNPNLTDIIELTDKYNMIEILTPAVWVNKSLTEINLRKDYAVSVMLIKRSDGDVTVTPGGDSILFSGDSVVICGKNEDIDKITSNFVDVNKK